MFAPAGEAFGPESGREVVLFADTFNRAYERENLEAALRVLVEGGYRVHLPKPVDAKRPLCCGRTFLSAGLIDNARAELDRLLATYASFAARGVPIVGLEPSCLLTLRDELLSLRNDDAAKSVSAHALLFEEFLVSPEGQKIYQASAYLPVIELLKSYFQIQLQDDERQRLSDIRRSLEVAAAVLRGVMACSRAVAERLP